MQKEIRMKPTKKTCTNPGVRVALKNSTRCGITYTISQQRMQAFYARMIRPTAGIARISALSAHQWASGSPRLLLRPHLTAKINPATTPTSATAKAVSPRLKHPITSTGVAATRKNTAGASAGRTMWRKVRLIAIE